MTEPLSLRRATGADMETPGRPLTRQPAALSAVITSDPADWAGDFHIDGYGFGHLKVRRQAPPAGCFGLRGDSLHLMLVCDGFHRGILADPGLRLLMVAGPKGLGASNGKAKKAMELAHAEMDIVTRPAFSWKHRAVTGRAPELQIAFVHLLTSELKQLAQDSGGIEVYFIIGATRGRAYINLDGTPGSNFQIEQHYFA